MATEQTPEPANIVLRRFFETSESARKAASHLKAPAEVGVRFTDVAGEYRFTLVDSKPRFLDGKAIDPDFELTMRGWVGVMLSGGGKVLGWLASKGLKGPSAVAHALSRLRKG